MGLAVVVGDRNNYAIYREITVKVIGEKARVKKKRVERGRAKYNDSILGG